MASLWRKTNSDWEKVTSTFPIEVPVRIGSVQTFTGTFETDADGYATVNCGFTPDIVVFDDYTQPTTLEGTVMQDRAVANLNGLSSGAWHESYFIVPPDGGSYEGVYTFATRPLANGFEVVHAYLGWSFSITLLSKDMLGRAISFTAYKF